MLTDEKIVNLGSYLTEAEQAALSIGKMSFIELSTLTDVLFRTNPDVAAWVARDLEIRAMDKTYEELGVK